MQAYTWKTQYSNWQNNQQVQSINSVSRIGIILYNSQQGSAFIDNIRLRSESSGGGGGSPPPPPPPSGGSPGAGIVYGCGNAFCLDDCTFYYSGTNLYYLIYYGDSLVQAALDSAVSMGNKVVRTWAFLDAGYITAQDWNGYWLQRSTSEGSFPEINYGDYGLKHLDRIIYEANQRGIKLILCLSDNWRYFGGIDQYAKWWGLYHHDDFFTNASVKATFKRWIDTLVNRVNHINGVRYGDDPTIFGWELINEPRCEGSGLFYQSGNCNPSVINNWVNEMSNYLRSLDSKHLIGVGDEGFFNHQSSDWCYNGSHGDFDAYLANPNIGFGTFHLYADAWGKSNDNTWILNWISDHANAGASAQKPVIMEEYGWSVPNERPAKYNSWTDRIYSSGLAGSNFWQLQVSGSPGDSYGVYYPDAATLVIKDHGLDMEQKNTCS